MLQRCHTAVLFFINAIEKKENTCCQMRFMEHLAPQLTCETLKQVCVGHLKMDSGGIELKSDHPQFLL